MAASVSGFVGCLSLIPLWGAIYDGSYIVDGNWNGIGIVFGPVPRPPPGLPLQ